LCACLLLALPCVAPARLHADDPPVAKTDSTNAETTEPEAAGIGTPVDKTTEPDATATNPSGAKVDFARDVRPLLKQHCFECHGPEKRESNFRLDDRQSVFKGGDFGDPAIVAGDSQASPLFQYVSDPEATVVMPPEGSRLAAIEVKLLRDWIDQGATWPATEGPASQGLTTDHWSFQPLSRTEPPLLEDPWVATPLDGFILAGLRSADLEPSRPAERAVLIRRLFLDMHGLPPTPQQVRAFVNDPDEGAYARLVEEVLASPRYGERWARHWLDVVRFAETSGFETNTPRPNAWHYRDYVIRAFNEDKPYDRFVFEQLAGDSVAADAATGFLVGGAYDTVKSPDVVLTLTQRQDELADMVNTTATAMLGITAGCARCHNHKFDPVLQEDYYALQAVFAGVRHGERPLLTPEDLERQQQARQIRDQLAALERELLPFQGEAFTGILLKLDDVPQEVATSAAPHLPQVTRLKPPSGMGTNPQGKERGHKDDPGNHTRVANVSQGQYTWWKADAGESLLSYAPALQGRYRVWISWGCGFPTHDPAAQYILDRDGDLQTEADQQTIASVDQRQFADGTKAQQQNKPLWSGFMTPGPFDFLPESRIIVRCNTARTAVTADVLLFEEVTNAPESAVAEGTVSEPTVTEPAVTETDVAESTEAEPAVAAGTTQPIAPPLRAAVNSRENVERFAPRSARYVRFTILATNGGGEPCLDELEIYTTGSESRNVGLAAEGAIATSSGDFPNNAKHKLAHLNDGEHGNDRSWISNRPGQGWVQIELSGTYPIDRIVWGRDRQRQFKDRLATQYRLEVASEPDEWIVVAESEDRIPYAPDRENIGHYTLRGRSAEEAQRLGVLLEERATLQERLSAMSGPSMVYAGQFEQPKTTHRLYRGDPMSPREAVAPDALSVLGTLGLELDAPEQQRRVALANWIANVDNPLTARVMVNRIWHYHFGTGLVSTPSDFGANGTLPTHPELLDWLARDLMAHGWSMKHVHRRILLSRTYRQSSHPREEALAVDAGSRLLWRFPPRRLEAETIRDSILAVSGTLRHEMGGPGFSCFEPNTNYVRNYQPKQTFGPEGWRRMVYMTKVRMEQDDVFGAFDCPDAGQVCPKRSRSTTPLQALNLLNSPFLVQQTEHFVQRLQRESGDDPAEGVRRAFWLALGRAPRQEETEAAVQLIAQHGMDAFCRALLNSNEMLFLP
jgi:hypothetical protein